MTSSPVALSCEVKVEGAWIALSLDEAASRHAMATKRCPACHGQVMITGAYSGQGVRRSLMHRRSHDGCPLQPKRYRGTPIPHPDALV